MKSSNELKEMAREMSRAFESGNKAANDAASALHGAARTAKAIEAGAKAFPKSVQQIETAVAKYEAAKTFLTPEWEDGKPPYASWNGTTYEVRHY